MREHARHGFTLVELMVVIAIIIALLALLLPSLGRAMAVAQQAVCASNQNQIGVSMLAYGADNFRSYPAGNQSGAPWDWYWMAQLRRVMGGAMEVFYCPAADEKTRWVKRIGSGLPADAYGWEADEYRLGYNRGSWFSYGLNTWGYNTSAAWGYTAFGTGNYNDNSLSGYQSMNSVVVPSSFIVLADSNWTDPSVGGGGTHWSAFIGGYSLTQYPGEVHLLRANVLFGDGHVEPRRRDELISFTFDDAINRQWNRDNQPHW